MNRQSAAQILHELDAIKKYLVAAQDVVDSGHMPDMSGLENRVSAVCQAIQAAAPETQSQCLPQLTVLLDQLNACERSIKDSPAAKEGATQ